MLEMSSFPRVKVKARNEKHLFPVAHRDRKLLSDAAKVFRADHSLWHD